MIQQDHTSDALTPLVLELGLTLIAVTLALCLPKTGLELFVRVETLLGRLAQRQTLSIIVCGALPCLLRLLILPWDPIPHPWIQDDFSYLLAADTFASGRLTNPTPPMWMHFESFHITLKPTYMSMYFPAQGMVLAAGQLLGGHPWFGVWASCGLMCAAICWALQGWLPARWALLGGVLAALRLGAFSYWMDTYTGGAVAATGGALVIGALPRLRKQFRAKDLFLMALGMAVLASSRPFEGLLISIPVLVVLARSLRGTLRESTRRVVWRMVPGAAVLVATLAFMGYYDLKLYGDVFTPPYKINRDTYSVAPHFLWQSARPEPVYRHAAMRNYYAGPSRLGEMTWFREQKRGITGFLFVAVKKVIVGSFFYFNFAFLPLLLALLWALRSRRMQTLAVTGLVYVAGMAGGTWFIPHYAAAVTALLYVLLMQSMRYLRTWGRSGLFLARAIPVVCVLLALLRGFAQPLQISLPDELHATQAWYGSAPMGLDRARVASELESRPGPQLAIVRYKPDHMYPEWVYNGADIEGSKLVWAREMDESSNRELLAHFNNRTAWLIEPDRKPPRVSRYSIPEAEESTHGSISTNAPQATLR